MKVYLQLLDKNAQIPNQAREGDFGYDVVATSKKEIAPNVFQYSIGLAYAIDRGGFYFSNGENEHKHEFIFNDEFWSKHLKVCIDFRPKSSIYRTGLVLSNCVGTLDELYRGEVKAIFYHVMPNMPEYDVGDEIGQICLHLTVPMEFEVVEAVDVNTDRGTGGFGSTTESKEEKVVEEESKGE